MRYIYLLAFAVVVWAGCPKPPQTTTPPNISGNGSPAQPARALEYRFPLPDSPKTLDPKHLTDTISDSICRRLYNTLVKYDNEGNIHNDLAEWHTISDDGLTYKFKLREDIRFHNGEQVTADDVIYSYTRLVQTKTVSERANLLYQVVGAQDFFEGRADSFTGLEKVDEFTVKFTLAKPYTPFIYVLCMTNFAIVPKGVVERDPKGFSKHPVGTGPFVFESWAPDDKVILKSNRDYFGTEPKIQTLIFRIIKDEKTRFEEFKAGNLEHCDIPASQITEVVNSAKLSALVAGEPAMDMYCYGFNCDEPPFKDNALLRRAFNYAVDKDNIIENIWGGMVSQQNTFVPKGMFYFWEDSPGYPYDPDKAKELMEQAGYPGGEGLPELTLNITVAETHKTVAEAVQSDLAKIGVTARIEMTAWGPYLEKVYAGEAKLFQNTWLGDYPDPDTWLYQLLHTENFGAAGNITRWSNEEFDHLLSLAQTESDPTLRAEYYNMSEKIAFDEAPWLFLFWKNSSTLIQPWVKGLKINKMDRTPQLNNAPIEEVYFEGN